MLIERAITALAHNNHEVAVGSELAHSLATISIWSVVPLTARPYLHNRRLPSIIRR